MQTLDNLFRSIKRRYDTGQATLTLLSELVLHGLSILAKANVTAVPKTSVGDKQYSVFRHPSNSTNGIAISRPFLPTLFIRDTKEFAKSWHLLIDTLSPSEHRIHLSPELLNRILYTASMSFCLCYDLHKPRSRKTPGTLFEVLLGSLLSNLLPNHRRTKHIPIPSSDSSVSTDIVMHDALGHGLVIPAKITTRERIVQPFAHQRILDSVFGAGHYRSVLACISEMQRDEEIGANEVCVPGTIRLFQEHLARLSGIYYLDPPIRYLQSDVTSIIEVSSLGHFFSDRLAVLVPPK